MGGISSPSPAVLKKSNGAQKIRRGGSTVADDLAAVEARCTTLENADYMPKAGGTFTEDVFCNKNLGFANNKGVFFADTFGTYHEVITVSETNATSFCGPLDVYYGAPNGYSGFLTVPNIANIADWNASGFRIGIGTRISITLDEDDMSSNSATALPTQQSVKAYVDNTVAAIPVGYASLIASADISSAVGVVDLLLTGGHDEYIIELINLKGAVNADVLRMRTSSDGGSTFDTGASDYSYRMHSLYDVSATHTSVSDAADYMLINAAIGVSNAADSSGLNVQLRVLNPAGGNYTDFYGDGSLCSADAGREITFLTFGGRRKSTTAVNAVRLYFSGGDIAEGKVSLYGVNR